MVLVVSKAIELKAKIVITCLQKYYVLSVPFPSKKILGPPLNYQTEKILRIQWRQQARKDWA